MELNKDLIDRIPYDPDREIPLIQSLELVQLRGNLALYLKASEYKDQIRAKFSYGNMMYDFSATDIRYPGMFNDQERTRFYRNPRVLVGLAEPFDQNGHTYLYKLILTIL